MSKMKNAIEQITNCQDCYGKGVIYWGNGEDYDFEYCDCNPLNLIIDNGEVIA
jgi:hypothetical protein